MYWDVLKKIIPRLREKYQSAKICFIINGSLLNIEIVDFFNKYNIYYNISYDGEKSYRSYDILKNYTVVSSIRRALSTNDKLVGFFPCQNNSTDSIDKIKSRLVSVLGKEFESKIKVVMDGICKSNCDEENNNYLIIGEDKLKEIRKEVPVEFLNRKITEKDRRFYHYKKSILNSVGFFENYNSCGFGNLGIICLDMKGNVYVCSNRDMIIGTLDNLENVHQNNFYHYALKNKCLNCHLINICAGGKCPLIKDENSNGFKINCNNVGSFSYGIFEALVRDIFSVDLISVKKME